MESRRKIRHKMKGSEKVAPVAEKKREMTEVVHRCGKGTERKETERKPEIQMKRLAQ